MGEGGGEHTLSSLSSPNEPRQVERTTETATVGEGEEMTERKWASGSGNALIAHIDREADRQGERQSER